MKYVFLKEYSVKGIKSLSNKISLSFYKKTPDKNIDTQKYNIKGIYGLNGSGKSGIISSVSILKQLLSNQNYLNNPLVQKHLKESINKQINQLEIDIEYFFNISEKEIYLFSYSITLKKDNINQFYISHEILKSKLASSRTVPKTIFEILDGNFINIQSEEKNKIVDSTKNLLKKSTFSSLYISKEINNKHNHFDLSVFSLFIFSRNLFVYLEQQDIHENYYIKDYIFSEYDTNELVNALNYLNDDTGTERINYGQIAVLKNQYDSFEILIQQLSNFIKIFKKDLQTIEIQRKENKDSYNCQLIMKYENYSISPEFESTGIKKLIKLFVYLKIMVNGKIVFIDEFDSNLHDVYLCAMIEYLMQYGKGQLCFTTHNIGPMDILKQNQNSIDFLSMNQSIASWKKNGHYQPSKLYRAGMIEGSPFNVDSIDFIGILDPLEVEK
ncbi:AAA family ATPase [Floccifex sp.]|uniref:AAA family ATPase n=1 Tax=Floccifex sp. TaxID=2815810 RepID=UPI003EFCAE35